MNEPVHFGLCDLPQTLQVLHLCVEPIICTIEPIAPSGSSMDSERPPNGIAEFVRAELILARKYLDSFRQTRAAHYRHFQATAHPQGSRGEHRDGTFRAPPRLHPGAVPIAASEDHPAHSHSQHRSPPTWSAAYSD